jgi:iron complex outermembrane receptor protein
MGMSKIALNLCAETHVTGHKLSLLAATSVLTLAGALLIADAALAQSSGTVLEEITVTGARNKRDVANAIEAEKAAKARSSIGAQFIERQQSGQTLLQSINILPGVNFTNNDPYGNSGGNLRIRGFDGPRISLTQDGIPLNDSGNYAIFSNQQIDPEILEKVTVNSGTTDVDSPTASAAGGTVNYRTIKPREDFGVVFQPSFGSFNYQRYFGMVNSGEIMNTGIKAFFAGSYTNYDKFKGPGELEKQQYNFKLQKDFANGDFINFAAHWNQNRNAFYRNPTKAQFQQYGNSFENIGVWVPVTGRRGLADDEGAGSLTDPLSTATPATGTNFYGLRINPSDTGNIRMQGNFHITKDIRLTVDPSLQYVLANGGGFTVFSESDARLKGSLATAAGTDLNGDGDTLDRVRLYTPNNTHTIRPGVNSSLIWDINDNNRARVSYSWERARHRQTAQFGFLDNGGFPENVFGGRDGRPVLAADGAQFRGRDRLSYAELNQFAADYRLTAMDDRLKVNVGVRRPTFDRELNQYCWTLQNTPAGGTLSSNQYCTSAAAPPTTTGIRIAPYSAKKTYDATLPNAGVSYEFITNSTVFISYAESLSAPRTDNLYGLSLPNALPETTKAIDFGYRYQGEKMIASVGGFITKYDNRIVTSFDPDTTLSIDRNVGSVDLTGAEFELGYKLFENFSLYASGTYTKTEVLSNLQTGATAFELTKGKELVETPKYQTSLRGEYTLGPVSIGAQAKYVGKRWSTDVNDEYAPAYWTTDLDLRYDLPEVWKLKSSFIQLNVNNLFDRAYLAGVATSRTRALGAGGAAPAYTVGAPRTISAVLHTEF